EVYVPLHIVRRPQPLDGASDELGIENLFLTPAASNPHALLLGDPGAGKTTGLLKLLHRCLGPDGPASLGLEPGTLPVFVRLRRFTPEDLDRPFAGFLQRELEREIGEVAKGRIAPDLGARLWAHGRLLLLLDGLDEIAEPDLRAQVCQLLDDWELQPLQPPHLRAVLSCRFSGYGAKVRLDDRFAPLAVRPLDATQCRNLVRRWFRAAQRVLPDRLSKQEALTATEGLITALDSPAGYGSQRWKVLVGSPLLLTLLCVIAYRGGQMPKHRTAFYDQCLRVLLGPWSRGKREGGTVPAGPPPLDVESALAVLRAVAWELHQRGSWGDLSVMELAVILGESQMIPQGRGQGRDVPARQVLE
ncbi:MAG TPA: NACHT domain-containing protein, partial [Thermoanaerobaculia bacterium]